MAAAAWPVVASAALVAGSATMTLFLPEGGPLTRQMVLHLGVMNVAAPLLALGLSRPLAVPPWMSAGLQMALLWAWHLPAVQQAAAGQPLLQAGMLGLLGLAALAFWSAIVRSVGDGRWTALAVLLVTGKLACLLGAVLILAPRDLYGLPGLALALCAAGPSTPADQHLAGLLMVTACPLSYLVAGVALAARALADLDTASG